MYAIWTFFCFPWRKNKLYFLHLHLVLAGRTADLFLGSWNNKIKCLKQKIPSRSFGIIYVRCFPLASRHFIPYGKTIIEKRISIQLCFSILPYVTSLFFFRKSRSLHSWLFLVKTNFNNGVALVFRNLFLLVIGNLTWRELKNLRFLAPNDFASANLKNYVWGKIPNVAV